MKLTSQTILLIGLLSFLICIPLALLHSTIVSMKLDDNLFISFFLTVGIGFTALWFLKQKRRS